MIFSLILQLRFTPSKIYPESNVQEVWRAFYNFGLIKQQITITCAAVVMAVVL